MEKQEAQGFEYFVETLSHVPLKEKIETPTMKFNVMESMKILWRVLEDDSMEEEGVILEWVASPDVINGLRTIDVAANIYTLRKKVSVAEIAQFKGNLLRLLRKDAFAQLRAHLLKQELKVQRDGD